MNMLIAFVAAVVLGSLEAANIEHEPASSRVYLNREVKDLAHLAKRFKVKCGSNNEKFRLEQSCDGHPDCTNNYDEDENYCKDSTYTCIGDTIAIELKQLCDGTTDCPKKGDDEAKWMCKKRSASENNEMELLDLLKKALNL